MFCTAGDKRKASASPAPRRGKSSGCNSSSRDVTPEFGGADEPAVPAATRRGRSRMAATTTAAAAAQAAATADPMQSDDMALQQPDRPSAPRNEEVVSPERPAPATGRTTAGRTAAGRTAAGHIATKQSKRQRTLSPVAAPGQDHPEPPYENVKLPKSTPVTAPSASKGKTKTRTVKAVSRAAKDMPAGKRSTRAADGNIVDNAEPARGSKHAGNKPTTPASTKRATKAKDRVTKSSSKAKTPASKKVASSTEEVDTSGGAKAAPQQLEEGVPAEGGEAAKKLSSRPSIRKAGERKRKSSSGDKAGAAATPVSDNEAEEEKVVAPADDAAAVPKRRKASARTEAPAGVERKPAGGRASKAPALPSDRAGAGDGISPPASGVSDGVTETPTAAAIPGKQKASRTHSKKPPQRSDGGRKGSSSPADAPPEPALEQQKSKPAGKAAARSAARGKAAKKTQAEAPKAPRSTTKAAKGAKLAVPPESPAEAPQRSTAKAAKGAKPAVPAASPAEAAVKRRRQPDTDIVVRFSSNVGEVLLSYSHAIHSICYAILPLSNITL